MKTSDYAKISTIEAFDNMEVLETRLTDRQFPNHFHDTFVIELVKSGSDVCEGTGLAAHATDVFVHTPNASHAGGPSAGKSLEYQAIYPSRQLASGLLNFDQQNIPQISFVSECDSLRRSIQDFFTVSVSTDRAQKLKQILAHVCNEATARSKQLLSKKRAGETESDELQIARKFLVDNCRRDVSIAELSEVCFLSQFHLIRAFKQKFGITPRQLLINQRVLFAKKLLAQGEPIASVALSAGFSDQSHLHRCFKRISGFNPGQYANSCRPK
jgi:AraC-like DNA-binding protein